MAADLHAWVGRTESTEDLVTPAPIRALSATLDRQAPAPQPGDPVPPLWHWLWFLPLDRPSELGPEGHRKKGGFLPPVELPRRMWAGGWLEFHQPLRVGDAIVRRSRIADIRQREGRTGTLVFVGVRHEIFREGTLALTEFQEIVYRGYPEPDRPAPSGPAARTDAVWEREIEPDDILLFRYSALTFNAHRIHYDRRWATEIEGYPGLVVHGPLIATLLLDLVRRNLEPAEVSRFEFRAVGPLFDTAPFKVCGRPGDDPHIVELWAVDPRECMAMTATAVLR